ncbi:hypothetical protein GCM10022220_38830 [Actinocatenispora rupis]|uniref:N-acetyltransferase domain-containing protein n=1 Tax=Actinocatenispora rupis TaxID=519421 RepID=A0A8J3IT21_9ACTN|nr:hypothetical protein Aru02nite_02750 [Actinocatenispora rupis]
MSIDHLTPADLRTVLAEQHRYWGDRDMRSLHHPTYVHEFGGTALAARAGGVVGYLLGFVAPTGDGYVHLVAVRDDARGAGVARALYDRFAELAAGRGATGLKAITTPGNADSVAFHRRLGFAADTVADYSGPGADRVVFRRPLPPGVVVGPARPADAGELLTVQHAAYVREALRYGVAIPPIVEDAAGVGAAIEAGGVLVARDGGRIVGTVRVRRVGADAEIGRLAVAPDRQGGGLGTRLLTAAEAAEPDAARYVLFTGHASDRNLDLYRRLGYAETHRAPGPTGVELVYLAKPNPTG